jgi:type I restriction-modification system DNA methylase subunit
MQSLDESAHNNAQFLDRLLDVMVEIARGTTKHQARKEALSFLSLVYLSELRHHELHGEILNPAHFITRLVSETEAKHFFPERPFTQHSLMNLERDEPQIVRKWLQLVLETNWDESAFPGWFSSKVDELGLTSYFGTPTSLSQLICYLFNENAVNTILDPACGTGSLLQVAAEHFGRDIALDGIELNSEAVAWATVRFLIGGYQNVKITSGDALGQDWSNLENFRKYDLVLANPPFGVALDPNSVSIITRYWRDSVWNPHNRLSSETAYVYLAFRSLSASGAAAIVVPNGFLVRGGADERLRELLIRENVVDSVIGLPARIFGPGATIDAAVLILKKQRVDRGLSEVLFLDARELAQRNGGRSILNDETIANIAEIVKNREIVDSISQLASNEMLANRSFSLSPAHYVKQAPSVTRTDPLERRSRIDELEERYVSLLQEYETIRTNLIVFGK